jgi:hypothetical protein
VLEAVEGFVPSVFLQRRCNQLDPVTARPRDGPQVALDATPASIAQETGRTFGSVMAYTYSSVTTTGSVSRNSIACLIVGNINWPPTCET